ncbi:Endonuclease/Exonuclease/phosphatase family protein [Nitrosospira sp. Nsp14]|nr:Endonuclease/Exonuclease/phosphatase family protein [Nitrosospira sp. Nsp14]
MGYFMIAHNVIDQLFSMCFSGYTPVRINADSIRHHRMKIATWNVNSLKVRLPQVLDWLASNQPDVLCLQETKLQDENFPINDIAAAGYLSTPV